MPISKIRTRFHVEAAAAARMSHPNIVQLYEVGETPEGFPFFSLEFVSGGTLAERLKQGPLRPREKPPRLPNRWPAPCSTPTSAASCIAI